jgi:hypothetical protein
VTGRGLGWRGPQAISCSTHANTWLAMHGCMGRSESMHTKTYLSHFGAWTAGIIE